ncbi:MAG: ABC transporter substrate-binding protein [Staphylococcus sp.]|nr:ABC transporter substrate-binding protein [Staphylococcus sp.]
MRNILYLTLVLLSLLTACVGKGSGDASALDNGAKLALRRAENLTLREHDGYYTATMSNPWDSTKILHTYILVPDTMELPRSLPEGTVVRTPLKNALVYSTVHQSLIGRLGARDAIGGICDAQYIHNPDLLARLADGSLADCGSSYSPNIERIIRLRPDALMLSPYENSGNYGKLGQLGIPIIECADYMESSPLGRAEWMKFYGLLFGKSHEAEVLFDSIETEYTQLKELVADAAERPSVIIDKLYGNTWYVPRHDSTMGTYIRDAGGKNPFGHIAGTGSAGLSGEQVLHEGGEADIWLLRYAQKNDKTLREFAADNAIYPLFKPLKNGKVYGCNTERIAYYEETPFNPHLLLRDLILVIHPEMLDDAGPTRYFTLLAE